MTNLQELIDFSYNSTVRPNMDNTTTEYRYPGSKYCREYITPILRISHPLKLQKVNKSPQTL